MANIDLRSRSIHILHALRNVIRRIYRISFCCMAFALVACGSPKDFIRATSDFAAATATVSEAYRQQIMVIHTLEADTHLRIARLNPEEDLNLKTLRDVRTFSEDALNARLDAVDAVVIYANLLAEAAGDDIGATFAEKVEAASISFQGLSKRFSDATNDPTDGEKLLEVGGLFTTIASNLGRTILERQQASAIRMAVISAEPDISKILDLLKDDIAVFKILRGTKADERLKEVIVAYNAKVKAHRANPTESKFPGKAHEQAHILVAEEYGTFNALSLTQRRLSDVLIALDKANEALAKVAESKDRERSTSELLATTQELRIRVEAVLKSIEALKK